MTRRATWGMPESPWEGKIHFADGFWVVQVGNSRDQLGRGIVGEMPGTGRGIWRGRWKPSAVNIPRNQ